MKIHIPLLAASSVLSAGQTRTWTQGEAADFEKGILKNLSLRSDGRLTLAPLSRELFDTSSSYLWALAQDSKGNLYAGGGTTAKLYRIPPDGKGKLLADLDALEIHAIAVDSRDRVYAATSPDGKIYRITGNGKPEVFYDPKAKYIWALAFDAAGNLFAATGDQGELHRVTPDGKGSVFFKTDETHIRSLTIDAKGNLILGTEPGGLVLRVTPGGRRIRPVPDAEARSDGSGAGSRWGDLCGCGGEPAGYSAPAPQQAPDAACSRAGPGRGDGGGWGGRAATGATAAFDDPNRCGRRQRGVSHRCGWRAAARVGTCAGRGVRDRLRCHGPGHPRRGQ